MKKITCSKILGISLTSSLIFASNITVQAETNVDFNNNGVIDSTDLGTLATNYNLKSGDSTWDSKYDLNVDNVVDVFDLVKISKSIGKTTTVAIPDSTDITGKFTNVNFRTEIYTLINKSNNEPILYSDVKNLKTLTLNYKNIDSLSGIEYFTSLTYLDCSSNGLIYLDVSKNTALTELYCVDNKLTILYVGNNTALTKLDCTHNQLKIIDTSRNTKLTELDCSANQIKALDVSKNTRLISLNCSGLFGSNELKVLDVSNNIALTDLSCDYNQLTNLDVSKNIILTKLYCASNQLTTLDISRNTALTLLDFGSNKLTTIDVSKNTELDSLDCYSNQLTALDVTKNTKLTDLTCGGRSASDSNQLTTLDISKNTALIKLYCSFNKLTTLDVSKNIELGRLDCDSNKLTTLDVSKNIKLQGLNCYSNQLTTLDVTNNGWLISLDCRLNQLTTLYSIKNEWDAYYYKIQYADSTYTATKGSLVVTIPLLDGTDITNRFNDVNFKVAVYNLIGKASPAQILYSDVKNITTLDVSLHNINNLSGIEYFTALTSLICYSNKLTTIDLSNNTALTNLDCYSNQLTTLDLRRNIALTTLNCKLNEIKTFYFIKNIQPTYYNLQYTDSTHITTINTLVITLPLADDTDITSKFTDANFKTMIYTLIGKSDSAPILYSDVKNIKDLDASRQNINSLSGIEYFTALNSLDCSYNGLTNLDISNNKSLASLDCSSNKLTILDISRNTALTNLDCSNNYLTILDASKNILLTVLDCSRNQLSTLYAINNVWCTREEWGYLYYQYQYLDSRHMATTNTLVILDS